MRRQLPLTACLLVMAGVAEANDGEEVFQTLCAGCHQVGEGAEIAVGPVLTGVVGRGVASTDFEYSDALLAKAGEKWTRETLDVFLAAPQDWAEGTMMPIAVEDPAARTALIAFLETHDGTRTGFAVAPEILAIEGDIAYGEYLSGECVTCHGAEGDDDGIPSITGWSERRFVTALHAYKESAREHPVMQMIAGRLGEEEIAALAAFFADIDR